MAMLPEPDSSGEGRARSDHPGANSSIVMGFVRLGVFYKQLTKARLQRDNRAGGCGYGGGAVRGPETGVGAGRLTTGLNALENVAKRE